MFTEVLFENTLIGVSKFDYEKKTFEVDVYRNEGGVREHPKVFKGKLLFRRSFTEDVVDHPEGALIHIANWVKKLARTDDVPGTAEDRDYWRSSKRSYGANWEEYSLFFHPSISGVGVSKAEDALFPAETKLLVDVLGEALIENGIGSLHTQQAIANSFGKKLLSRRA